MVSLDNGIIGNTNPLNKYFAFGIRNSFGMDFDPITGKVTKHFYIWGCLGTVID
jgi:hypothetical protein